MAASSTRFIEPLLPPTPTAFTATDASASSDAATISDSFARAAADTSTSDDVATVQAPSPPAPTPSPSPPPAPPEAVRGGAGRYPLRSTGPSRETIIAWVEVSPGLALPAVAIAPRVDFQCFDSEEEELLLLA